MAVDLFGVRYRHVPDLVAWFLWQPVHYNSLTTARASKEVHHPIDDEYRHSRSVDHHIWLPGTHQYEPEW